MSETHPQDPRRSPDDAGDGRLPDGRPFEGVPRPDALARLVEATASTPRGERRVPTRPPVGVDEAMAELATISLSEASLTDVVRQVAALAQASIPGADEVSVTLVEGAKAATVVFTGDLAVQLDERQYDDGSGPCMDAARQGGTVPLFDLDLDQRYPGFVDAARRVGVTGSLSVGMAVPSRVVGALNIYARSGGSVLGPSSVTAAEAFAGYAAITLANAHLLHSAQRFAEQIQLAMVSRATIEQAKGILMARTGCSPDDAFAELVRLSRTQNRKVAALSAELVAAARRR